MKNIKGFLAGFLVFVLIFSFTGCNFINDLFASDETKEEAPAYDLESSGEMREGKFALDGVNYQLPMPTETLLNTGWTIANIEDNLIVVAGDDVIGKIYSGPVDRDNIPPVIQTRLLLEKNGKKMQAITENLASFENIPIEECHITQLTVYKNYPTAPVADIILPGAITVDSPFETIVNTYGPADYFTYSDFYDSLDYHSGINLNSIFSVSVQKDTGSDIRILSVYALLDADGSPVGVVRKMPSNITFTAPDYITNYMAPAVLGATITNYTISIEGLLIQLPVPVSVLMNAGWKINTEHSYSPLKTFDYLTANQRLNLSFENAEGLFLPAYIANYDDQLQTLENCMVYSVSYSYNIDDTGMFVSPGYHFELPGGISENSTFEEAAIATAGILMAHDYYIGFENYSEYENIAFSFVNSDYYGDELPPEMNGVLSYMEIGKALEGQTLWE